MLNGAKSKNNLPEDRYTGVKRTGGSKTHLGKFFERILQETHDTQTVFGSVDGCCRPEIPSAIFDAFDTKSILYKRFGECWAVRLSIILLAIKEIWPHSARRDFLAMFRIVDDSLQPLITNVIHVSGGCSPNYFVWSVDVTSEGSEILPPLWKKGSRMALRWNNASEKLRNANKGPSLWPRRTRTRTDSWETSCMTVDII